MSCIDGYISYSNPNTCTYACGTNMYGNPIYSPMASAEYAYCYGCPISSNKCLDCIN